jgi:hypothetical protein
MILRISPLFRVLVLSAALCLPMLALPGQAMAQAQPNPLEGADGRIRGYEQNSVVMDDSSTALTYLALIALTVISVGLMFKSARRTHLD